MPQRGGVRAVFAALMLLGVAGDAPAQSLLRRLWTDFWHAPDSARANPLSNPRRRVNVLPFPTLTYAPETRLRFGFYTAMDFRLDSTGTARPGNLGVEFNYSVLGQLGTELEWNFLLPNHAWLFSGYAYYRFFPEDYYGQGNRTAPNQRERYDLKRVEADVLVLRGLKLHHNWFAGPRYRLQYVFDLDPRDPDGAFALNQVPGQEGGLTHGLGLVASFDERSNLRTPRRGQYALLSWLWFSEALGSRTEYHHLEADLRKYIPLSPNLRHILALQLRGEFTTAQAPFRMQPLLGSDDYLRGYYRGRYRDRHTITFQTEYRWDVFWRLGLTLFAGVGDVLGPNSTTTWAHLKPTLGVGTRFKMDRRGDANLRIDLGWGSQGNQGLYFSYGEAF